VRVGDLVRPKSHPWQNHVGFVVAINFLGSIEVRMLSGGIKVFNSSSLETLSERNRNAKKIQKS